jgi:hypothetical protein
MPKLVPYTDEIAAEICEVIAQSSKGLRQLCEENPNWPRATTIKKWRREIPSFTTLYARAKAEQADLLAEEILEIADNIEHDFEVDEDGKVYARHDHINRARLRIDTRKWYASKLAPKIYGDNKETKANDEDAISQFRVENE